ncbi:ribonuclease P protein component [Roseococcus sp. DSY-14]|uniref:ribonuclease P protein component n=1 Tax=Roseococcus sp. DSY-14 TaxID=3369650 RepID=UPI00387A9652
MAAGLKRRAEFLRAAREGRKAAGRHLVLQALPRGDEAPARLGFTATKKIGDAVTRNRAKRRLRAAARLVLAGGAAAGHDLVLIARDGTPACPWPTLLEELRAALRRTGAAP